MGNPSFVQPLHHGDQDNHQVGQRHYQVHQVYQVYQVSRIANGLPDRNGTGKTNGIAGAQREER